MRLKNIKNEYLKNKNENERNTQAWHETRCFRSILDNRSSQSRGGTAIQCPQEDGAKRVGWDGTQRLDSPTLEIIYQGSHTTLWWTIQQYSYSSAPIYMRENIIISHALCHGTHQLQYTERYSASRGVASSRQSRNASALSQKCKFVLYWLHPFVHIPHSFHHGCMLESWAIWETRRWLKDADGKSAQNWQNVNRIKVQKGIEV